jgi:hypothetical protein
MFTPDERMYDFFECGLASVRADVAEIRDAEPTEDILAYFHPVVGFLRAVSENDHSPSTVVLTEILGDALQCCVAVPGAVADRVGLVEACTMLLSALLPVPPRLDFKRGVDDVLLHVLGLHGDEGCRRPPIWLWLPTHSPVAVPVPRDALAAALRHISPSHATVSQMRLSGLLAVTAVAAGHDIEALDGFLREAAVRYDCH